MDHRLGDKSICPTFTDLGLLTVFTIESHRMLTAARVDLLAYRGPRGGQVDILLAPSCTATFSHAAGFDPARLHLAASVGMTRPRPNSATPEPVRVRQACRSKCGGSCMWARRRDLGYETPVDPYLSAIPHRLCLLSPDSSLKFLPCLRLFIPTACLLFSEKLCYCLAYIVYAILISPHSWPWLSAHSGHAVPPPH